jgi:hypothetical protein
MSKEAMKLALEAAYLAGFNASGEGYNGEYPFQDHNAHPAQDEGWCQNRDAYIREVLAEQTAPMIRGDIRDGLVDDEPAQRKPWVGLTDEEQNQVAWSCGAMSADWLDFARAIEAKLRERNT